MNISPVLSRSLNQAFRQVQHHSPTILTVAGVVGVVASTVLIAKATLKLGGVLDDGKARIEKATEIAELTEPGAELEKPALTKIYIKNAVEVGKVYVPGGTLLTLSLAALLVSHGIMRQRNLALVAAYKTLETAFNTYRQRVVEEYGEQVDEDFRLGVKRNTEIDPDTKKKVKSLESVGAGSPFVYDFGIMNPNFQGSPDQNLHFLHTVEAMFNERLKRNGVVVLRDVLDILGFKDQYDESALINGWVFDPHNPNTDSYINFRVKDLMETNGYYVLDFNVDGLILDHFAKN